jgi:hypothetical protein
VFNLNQNRCSTSPEYAPKENIYVNVVHTVDGAWNLDGQAMTNEELGEAISRG